MAKEKKLTIDEKIELLHEIIDEFKGSTKLEFEIEREHIDFPASTKNEQEIMKVKTGKTTLHVRAYDLTKDERKEMYWMRIQK